MKKFLKNRTELKSTSPVENLTRTPVVAIKADEPKEDVKVKPALLLQAVQPPLPPYPPPPDSPPVLGIVIKKEKSDIEDTPYNECNEPENQEPEQTAPQDQVTSPDTPKIPMCKEFIRGNCKRPVCKYAHVIDIAQLPGVFTFCWNYQNDVCKFPNCRYVHADIFEEAEFYRTGILPPHARSHQKKAPHPPPPPEETQQRTTETPISFANPPPGILSSISARPGEDVFKAPLPRSTSPLKRDWNVLENFSSVPRDLEADQLPKKCKNCEMMEFRVQYNKEKVEKQIEASEEFNKTLAALSKKSAKLVTVLLSLMGERSLMEQVDSVITGNNRLMSVINDDSLKNLSGSSINLSSLMKLFCSTGDQTLAVDTRET